MTADPPTPPDADAPPDDDPHFMRDAWRYTVLRHKVAPGNVHYDLLLSFPGHPRLVTFQLPCPPESIPPAGVQAKRLPDHRRLYLTYEGPISNNRGSVTQYAIGTFSISERLGVALNMRTLGEIRIIESTTADLHLHTDSTAHQFKIVIARNGAATLTPTDLPAV